MTWIDGCRRIIRKGIDAGKKLQRIKIGVYNKLARIASCNNNNMNEGVEDEWMNEKYEVRKGYSCILGSLRRTLVANDGLDKVVVAPAVVQHWAVRE